MFVLCGVLCAPLSAFAKAPNDPLYEEQWYLGQMSAEDAWNTSTGSRDVVVAVLDTGVDLDHPDLEPNIWVNDDEIAANNVDDDDNGFVDDVYGWDFVQDDNDPTPIAHGSDAAMSHGTVIAGIIGAQGNNDEGITGINWSVSLMSVRMLNVAGSGNSATASRAIDYAVANGADVINLSFAGDVADNTLKSAVERAYDAGVVIVAAMGNESQDTDDVTVYPACLRDNNNDWVIGVASTDMNDDASTFSNYGETCTDVSAPGEEIYGSQYEDVAEGFDDAYGGFWSGTSVASPMVAGAAALLLSAYPDLTVEEVRTVLKLSVDPLQITDLELRGEFGVGRINLAQALSMGASYSDQEEAETGDEEADGQPETGISPVTGEVEEISDVVAGMYIRSEYFSTVYYIENDDGILIRRPFIDAQTFLTWQDDWDVVETVTDATLPTMALGAPMLPKAGVVLVKIQSDNVVYALEGDNTLREIASESLAIAMYGSAWADYVIDISPTLWPRFEVGEVIATEESVDTGIMKTRAEVNQ